MAGGLVTSLRLGSGFAGPGGPSANLEAREVLFAGIMAPLHPPPLTAYAHKLFNPFPSNARVRVFYFFVFLSFVLTLFI